MMTKEESERLLRKGTTRTPGHLWQCGACGKRSWTRYGFYADQSSAAIDREWDESCMLNSAMVPLTCWYYCEPLALDYDGRCTREVTHRVLVERIEDGHRRVEFTCDEHCGVTNGSWRTVSREPIG